MGLDISIAQNTVIVASTPPQLPRTRLGTEMSTSDRLTNGRSQSQIQTEHWKAEVKDEQFDATQRRPVVRFVVFNCNTRHGTGDPKDNQESFDYANIGAARRRDVRMRPLSHSARTSREPAFLFALGCASGLQTQDISAVPEGEIIKDHSANSEKTTFQWKSVLVDVSIFLGIEHGFRLAQDPLVREGLRGPFFEDYFDSVKSIHGWGDGDPFMVNYIGHPTMGAVAGFIETSNDPRYHSVEVGASPQSGSGSCVSSTACRQ
jgi:hypothetical protein